MSHIGGGAGWRKSPSPDLVRGWVGQPPSLLYNAHFCSRPQVLSSGLRTVTDRKCLYVS